MADQQEKVVINYEIDTAQALKNVDALVLSIAELKTQLKANQTETKSLEKTNANLSKALQGNVKNRKELEDQIKKNNDQIRQNRLAEAKLKDSISETNKARQSELKTAKLQSNSLAALRKEVSTLTKERDNLNLKSKDGEKRFDLLTKKIKENNDIIQKADMRAGNFKSSIGGYEQAITNALGPLGMQITSLKRTVEGLKATQGAVALTTKSLGIFKTALISTGVGALVVALGSLITFLTKTQRGMDFVNKVLSSAGAILDVVIDRVSSLGEAIFKLFSGDFEGAYEAASKAVQGFGEEVAKEADQAWELEQRAQQLEKDRIGFIVERAKIEAEIAKNRRLAKETEDKDNQKSLEYNQKAIDLTKKLLEADLYLAKEEAAISQARLDMGESSNEQIRETEELKAKAFETEKANDEQIKKLLSERLTLEKKVAKERAALEKEQAERDQLKREQDALDWETLIENAEMKVELLKDTNEQLEEVEVKYREERKEFIEESLANELKMQEDFNKASQNLQNQAIKTTFALLSNNLTRESTKLNAYYSKKQDDLEASYEQGLITEEEYNVKKDAIQREYAQKQYEIELEQFKLNKAQALIGIAIDTARGVVAALAELNVPLSIAIGATGALQAITVASQPAPTPPTFAEGGYIGTVSGKSHKLGGEKIFDSKGTAIAELERGEDLYALKADASSDKSYLDRLNTKYGGRSYFGSGSKFLQEGGKIDTSNALDSATIAAIVEATARNVVNIVRVEDIQTGINNRNDITGRGVIVA